MSQILHLDASPRGERSISRVLSRRFVELWKVRHPADGIAYRDVGRAPPPHVTEAWVEGAYTPFESQSDIARNAMAISDTLIEEFLAADRYVFGVPMHNFHVPSGFKVYVDQIVRVGRTFSNQWEGLVHGKKMLFITTRGGNYAPGSSVHPYDHQEPWLRTVFGFLGITNLTFIHAQGMNLGEETRNAGLQQARERIEELVEIW